MIDEITFSTDISGSDVTPSEAFPYQMELQSDDRYWLFWKYDETSITMEIHAATRGWVGVGISTSGRMPGSDIITAGIDTRTGTNYIQVNCVILKSSLVLYFL